MNNIKPFSAFESSEWSPDPRIIKEYKKSLEGVDLQSLVGKTVRIIQVEEDLPARDETIVEISEDLTIRTRKGTDDYALGFALASDVKRFVKEGTAWLHPDEVLVVLVK